MIIEKDEELAREWFTFSNALANKIYQLRQLGYLFAGGAELTEEGNEILKQRISGLTKEVEMICKTTIGKVEELRDRTLEKL